jgi:hypothetical protein
MILFHRFLIATAILFCAGFAAWTLAMFRSDGSTRTLALGVAFALAAAGLGYYLRHLDRFLRR